MIHLIQQKLRPLNFVFTRSHQTREAIYHFISAQFQSAFGFLPGD